MHIISPDRLSPKQWLTSLVSDVSMAGLVIIAFVYEVEAAQMILVAVLWITVAAYVLTGTSFSMPLDYVIQNVKGPDFRRFAATATKLGNRSLVWRIYDTATDAAFVVVLAWFGLLWTAVALGLSSWFCKLRAKAVTNQLLTYARQHAKENNGE